MLKIKENLFLGVQEYQKLSDFMSTYGFDRNFLLNAASFGLFTDFRIPELGQVLREDCLYVRKAGTPFDSIIVQRGAAVDLEANVIINNVDTHFTIPNDNSWYWVRASHVLTSKEKGTVSIDALGNLTGVGTEFTKIFRGQPHFPTKVKFYNSVNQNVSEYEIVKVISDTSCILYGDFNSETGLAFSVIGTFTPGYIVPDVDKQIYQYDSINLQLVKELSSNTPPAYQLGKQFYLARVRNTGADVVIQDKRKDWFKTHADDSISRVNRSFANPLIGVEAVKYDVTTSTKDKNIVELAHGFRFSSYTIDTSSKKISILIGVGGVFKTTAPFVGGQFDEWRLYFKDGSFSTVIDSQKSGTQIILTLDVMIPDIIGAADLLFIAPPYEEIEVKCMIPAISNTEQIFAFKNNTPICRFKLNSIDSCTLYNMVYRYKNNFDYTDWKKFPNDVIGHYNETSFLPNGSLQPLVADRTQIPYVGSLTAGFIKVCEHINSYDNFQELINTGDLFGVNTTALSNSAPIVNLVVGTDKRYQHFKTTITLTADVWIVLRSQKASGAPLREGNEFFLHFEQFIDLNGYRIRIVQNYVNPTNYLLVAQIDENDAAFIKNNVGASSSTIKRGLFMRCTYNDLGKWIAFYNSDVRSKGELRILDEVPTGAFINDLGVATGYWGWKIMPEMADTFIKGTTNLTAYGADALSSFGGSNNMTLVLENIPPHFHQFTGSTDDNGDPGPFVITNTRSGWGNINSYNAGGLDGAAVPFAIRPRYRNFAIIKKIV